MGEKDGVCTETCLDTGLELLLDKEQGEGAGSSYTGHKVLVYSMETKVIVYKCTLLTPRS